MLDYILSKMVLLIFLLLLVATFMGFRSALQDYFLQQNAQDVVHNVAERLRGMALSTTTVQEIRTYVLPRYVSVSGKSVPYQIGCQVATQGSAKWVVFSVLIAGKVIAYDGVALSNATVKCTGFPVESTGKDNVIYIKKVITGSSATYSIWVGS